MPLPATGLAANAVLARLEAFRAADVPWREGKVLAYVYDPGPDAEAVGKAAYAAYLSDNGLDPTAFPSILAMEKEVVSIVLDGVSAPAGAGGSFTSGGTESILLAVKGARDRARARGFVGRLNLVVPATAHAAFHKAAHYLDLDVRIAAIDPSTFRADPAAMDALCDAQTILLVGSAPSYAHGVIDPIEAIAAVAMRRSVLCHVDGCVGGFLLPYFRALGQAVPAYDFSVPGVTSMSVDLHKYAFCPKGASTVLWRTEELRAFQMYACATWTGYAIVNPTVQSSKSGGPVAAAWATLHHLGRDGYGKLAAASKRAVDELLAGLADIPVLRVLGRPEFNLLAIASDGPPVFAIADAMKDEGFLLQPQFSGYGSPANLHLSMNPTSLPHVPALIDALRRVVARLDREPAPTAPAELLQLLASLPESPAEASMSSDAFAPMFAMLGVSSTTLPPRMAPVNEALDALPPPWREAALKDFVLRMSQP